MSTVLLFYVGSCIGSFLQLVTMRLQLGLPITFSRSQCDNCQIKLHPLQLFPILSFILHKGRCLHCYHSLSKSYLVIEMLAGLIVLYLNVTHPSPAIIILIIFLFMQGISDYYYMVINPSLYFLSLGLTLPLKLIESEFSTWLVTSLVPALVFLAILLALRRLLKNTFGFGDIKLIFAIGLILTIDQLLMCLLSASLLGIIFILSFRWRGPLPFVPFLFIGLLLSLRH